jgi:hypothetical protein
MVRYNIYESFLKIPESKGKMDARKYYIEINQGDSAEHKLLCTLCNAEIVRYILSYTLLFSLLLSYPISYVVSRSLLSFY